MCVWLCVLCVCVASAESEVRLLTLSKEDYDEIKDRYPEVRLQRPKQ